MFCRFISLGAWVSHLVFSKAPLFEKSSSLGTWCVDVEAYGFLYSWIRSVDLMRQWVCSSLLHSYILPQKCLHCHPCNLFLPCLIHVDSRIAPSQKKSGKLQRNKVRRGTFRILADFSLMDYLKKKEKWYINSFYSTCININNLDCRNVRFLFLL